MKDNLIIVCEITYFDENNMVVIIMCFDRKDILTCLVFMGCLVFVKGEIKKKQPKVRMLSVCS